jgi:hypothetical protein
VGSGDCALSGGIRAFDDSCTKDGSVAALDFNARCWNPDVGSRPGCVWPFVYKGINFTEGQCAEVDHADGGYFGWCATEGSWQYDVISCGFSHSDFVTDEVCDVQLRCGEFETHPFVFSPRNHVHHYFLTLLKYYCDVCTRAPGIVTVTRMTTATQDTSAQMDWAAIALFRTTTTIVTVA